MSENQGKLSGKIEKIEQKLDSFTESTQARFLSQEREDALGCMTVLGKGCPHREPREKLFSVVSQLSERVLGITIQPGDLRSVTRLSSSRKSYSILLERLITKIKSLKGSLFFHGSPTMEKK